MSSLALERFRANLRQEQSRLNRPLFALFLSPDGRARRVVAGAARARPAAARRGRELFAQHDEAARSWAAQLRLRTSGTHALTANRGGTENLSAAVR
jgi:hypothetical protein